MKGKMKGIKTDLLVFLVIFAFLLSYFTPDLILKETTIAGGDTSSHYIYAEYMKNYLLPHGKVSGWFPGAYAGFPVFRFYFFPPFVLAAIMGYIIPLEVAFKIVTILGIFSLPLAAFFAMRFMRFEFPIPIVAAVFTLPFLFMEANSMWGGNIPSTLAGEFSYSISLSLVVLFIGLLFRNMEYKKGYNATVLLLFSVILTHVYTALFAVLCSGFFLLTRNREKLLGNLKSLIFVFLVSFMLVGFWILPLVGGLAYTTPYADIWKIESINDVFPQIFYPFYFFAVFGLYWSFQRREKSILFICYSILTALALFLLAPKLGIVNIRFIPFIQLLILLVSAYGIVELVKGLKGNWVIPLIAIAATIMWVNYNVTFIPTWIEWNYEGFENKPLWEDYSGVNEFLKGTENDPRVVFEHSSLHNSAGSTRAFESLPHFSGRSTLEGLYMQSSITSPFVFFLQSEISKVGSCPFTQWPCSRFNSTLAARHLEMFNVREIVAASDKVKAALKEDENYKLAASFPPYEIYELLINRDRYVVVPDYEPVMFETGHWKEDSYLWFLRFEDVPLVFEGPDKGNFKLETSSLEDIPRVQVENNCQVQSTLKNEEILIKTDCIGKPHIIRVSYSPNWKVEGASGVYLVSPSFMLIYPEKEDVRLYYGRTVFEYLGLILSLIGVLLLMSNKRWRPILGRFIDANLRYLILISIFAAAALAALMVSHSLASEKWDRGTFIAEVGVSMKNHVICDRIESRDIRDGCFKDVAIATGDYNLCDVRVESLDLKDECFKEVGISRNDFNLCDVKIQDQTIKNECFKEVGIKTNDYNLCDVKIKDLGPKDECIKEVAINTDDTNLCEWKISNETLKKECYAAIAEKGSISK